MTSTPIEPEPDPEIVPAGDPAIDPISPDEEPGSPVPETQPAAP